jgi:2-methylfumaryl-CoA hydratase
MIDGHAEDFQVGQRFRHWRGRTVTEFDLSVLTLLVMNTAQGHFNEQSMAGTPFGTRINFGGLTLALVVGLATPDTTAQAIAEVGLDGVRFQAPVRAGDTIRAVTEVLAVEDDDRPDAAIVRFRHWGINQDDAIVCVADRAVLVRRRVPAVAAQRGAVA